MTDLGTALLSPPGTDARLHAFGRLVGAWDLEWHSRRVDEVGVAARGSLTVGWVLDGRAVQDVWQVPGADEPGVGLTPRAFHGTTIRMLDTDGRRWRSTWIDPLNSRVRCFVGTERGDRVELLSLDEEPWLRWSFVDVEPERFRWTGELSTDRGATWLPDDEMWASRQKLT